MGAGKARHSLFTLHSSLFTYIEETYLNKADRNHNRQKDNNGGRRAAVIEAIKSFLNKAYRNNIAALSGQSAFFLILSFIPLVMFVFAMFSIITGKSPDLLQIDERYRELPPVQAVYTYLLDAVERSTSGTAIVTAILALWSAGRGLYSITDGIARIYRLPRRLWILRRVYAMGYTAVLIVMFILSFALTALDVYWSNYLADALALSGAARTLVIIGEHLFAAAAEFFFLTLALRIFLRPKVQEKRYTRFKALAPGMLFTVVGWTLLDRGVRLYLTYCSTSSLYGSLGTVAVLMSEVYFAMMILLYGVQMNYIYRDRFAGSIRL
jgi:membrane protein